MDENQQEKPAPALKTGIIYNLKKGAQGKAEDEEAEYDSIKTVYAIRDALEKRGHTVELLEADENLPQKLKDCDIDIAFNIAEGKGGRGREAQIPAICNLYDIKFTGSDETTLCVALDKALTKRLAATYRIKSPRYEVISDKSQKTRLNFPVIVKPNAEGSGKGISDISICSTKEELKKLIEKNLNLYGQNMLVEEFVEGREFTVGILGNGKDARVFPPMEIIYKVPTQGNWHVYSYKVKQQYKNYVEYKCPAQLTEAQTKKMTDYAAKIFSALSCNDFARADFRMDDKGEIYFIEINPLPGLAPGYSDYPMLAEFSGMKYDDLINGVLDTAVKRLNITGDAE